MCLNIDSKKTDAVKLKLSKDGFIIGYKILSFYNNVLSSTIFNIKPWKNGWNLSSRRGGTKLIKREKMCQEIYRGIHVFLNRPPKSFIGIGDYVIVRVKCYPKHFVAAGGIYSKLPGGVFTKVFLDEKDYRKAIGG